MGTSVNAFIEYDDETRVAYEDGKLHALTDPPFATDVASVAWDDFCLDKEYSFFAAIAGVRNSTDIEPLYPPRGLPTNLSPAVRMQLVDDDGKPAGHTPGWLLPHEIDAALAHMSVDRQLLSFRVQMILEIMTYLARCLGKDRVRLVWTFD